MKTAGQELAKVETCLVLLSQAHVFQDIGLALRFAYFNQTEIEHGTKNKIQIDVVDFNKFNSNKGRIGKMKYGIIHHRWGFVFLGWL